MDRERTIRILAGTVAIILLAGSLAYAFAHPKKTATSTTPTEVTHNLITGWYDGAPVDYFDFGSSGDSIGNLYILVTGFDANGNPQLVSGQNDIFNMKRGDSNYSDFWHLYYFTVPSDYQANSVKSESDLLSKNWTKTDSGKVVNEPQVSSQDKIFPDRQMIKGWINGQEVSAWRFENNVLTNPNDASKVSKGTLYIFITGFDSKGNPQLVSGQNNVLGSVPGESDYTPLWHKTYVTVPSNYTPNSIKSDTDIDAQHLQTTDSGTLINGPVYDVNSKVMVPAENTLPAVMQQMAPKTQPTQPSPPTQPSQPSLPMSASVTIANLSFQPSSISVAKGGTVTWTNNDTVTHTVTSDTGAFSSSNLNPGQSFSFTFNQTGSFGYHCSIHPFMTATVNAQ